MADVLEDPKKKKASFGDSAAAATDPNVTQLKVGKPGDFPVNPDGTPMEKKAPAMAPSLGALPPTPTSTPSQPQAQSQLANQTAMYVAGAQAANPQPSVMAINPPGAMARPVPMSAPEFTGPGAMLGKPGDFAPRQPSAQAAMATGADAQRPGVQPEAPAAPQSEYSRQMGEVGAFFGALPKAAAKWITSAPGSGGPLDFSGQSPAAGAVQPGAAQTAARTQAFPDGRANAFADPRSLLNPNRQEPPVTGAPVAAPIAAAGAAPPPSLEGMAIAPTQTEGQRVMDMNNKLADSMKADRLASEQEALGVPQNTVVHSGNDWAARKALANLETGASSIMNKTGGRGGVSPAVTAYVNAFNADRALQGGGTAADINNTNVAQQNAAMKATQGTEALRMKQSSAQFGANQEIAKQRLALDGRKADIADTGAQMDNATKKQLQGLNAQILNETDPAKLSVLQDKAQTITGKYQRPDAATRMTVVPQGSYIDEKTQQVLQKPSLVLGPDGQVMGQQTQQAAATVKSQSDFDKLKKGDTYTGEDGKTYRK